MDAPRGGGFSSGNPGTPMANRRDDPAMDHSVDPGSVHGSNGCVDGMLQTKGGFFGPLGGSFPDIMMKDPNFATAGCVQGKAFTVVSTQLGGSDLEDQEGLNVNPNKNPFNESRRGEYADHMRTERLTSGSTKKPLVDLPTRKASNGKDGEHLTWHNVDVDRNKPATPLHAEDAHAPTNSTEFVSTVRRGWKKRAREARTETAHNELVVAPQGQSTDSVKEFASQKGILKRKVVSVSSAASGENPDDLIFEDACHKKPRSQAGGAELEDHMGGVAEAGLQPRRSL